ncbi:hypothetical protein ACHWQZ_G008089 [Mnemiopsis leidyi]
MTRDVCMSDEKNEYYCTGVYRCCGPATCCFKWYIWLIIGIVLASIVALVFYIILRGYISKRDEASNAGRSESYQKLKDSEKRARSEGSKQ